MPPNYNIDCIPSVELENLDPDINLPISCNSKYYSTQDISKDYEIRNCMTGKHFSVLHCNIRSLNANFDNFNHLLSELNYNFSVIGLTETKFKVSSQPTFNNNINGYRFHSQPSLSNAGGVAFYVQENLSTCLRDDLSYLSSEYECLWIELESDLHHNIICGVIYRHPHSNLESFINYLDITINKINLEKKYCIIMGDFNIDLLKSTSHTDTDKFLHTLESYFFNPHILQPTRITNHSATLIDNIFFNSLTHHTISGNIVYDLTDHLPNFLIISKLHLLPKNIKIFRRDYTTYDESQLLDEIKSIDWNKELKDLDDASHLFDNFYSKLSSIINKHVPMKPLSRREIKQSSKPWITYGIRTSIRVKNRLYKKYIKTKSSYYHNKFKLYRNKLNHLVRKSKINYYNNYFNTNKTNIKNVWKGIKEIIGSTRSNATLPSKFITENNIELTDCKDIANHFNEFFSNIGSNLASSLPDLGVSPMDFLPPRVGNSFNLTPVTDKEVQDEIEKLNPKKAVGPFSIPIPILKSIKHLVAEPLKHIFNISFSSGIVPESFKVANITPVFKKGSQINVNNYRPISLLSVFNRILEKLMCKRLLEFINKNDILYNKQFGFRKKHSTTLAILSITDSIKSAIENNNYSCGIFLDLSKAFDTVNHQLLLSKLDHYGIRGLVGSWFSSYLNNRKQFVSLGSICSETLPISCGVPQGSVLGPILFLLYINDMSNSSTLLSFHLFADDSNLFYSNKSLLTLEATINNELLNVYSWLCANKLSLNIEKSNFIIFHTIQKKVHEVSIAINDKPIKQEKQLKYLGVMIDSHMNWKAHISYICNKIKRSIGIISKARHYINLETLTSLYYSLIYPYLIYGIVIWGHAYKSVLTPLFILQKKAIRLMTFSHYYNHSTPLFLRLRILKLEDLVYLHTSLFMYDFHENNLPSIFNNFFVSVKQRHSYNTRLASKSSYSLPKVRTNYGLLNIKFVGAKIWNSIDESLKKLSRDNFIKSLYANVLKTYI